MLELDKKQRKEILRKRWQDVEEKPTSRKRTEKELMEDKRCWEEC